MNFEADDWEMFLLWLGIDPGSRKELECIDTAWACGFEEEAYQPIPI